MNTPTEWKTVAVISNPERLAFWQSIFGGDTVPICFILPMRANLPGHPGALVYMLDLRVITGGQRAKLVQAIAEKFNLPEEEVERELNAQGVPILADDVTVSSRDSGLLMSAIDDSGYDTELDDYDPASEELEWEDELIDDETW